MPPPGVEGDEEHGQQAHGPAAGDPAPFEQLPDQPPLLRLPVHLDVLHGGLHDPPGQPRAHPGEYHAELDAPRHGEDVSPEGAVQVGVGGLVPGKLRRPEHGRPAERRDAAPVEADHALVPQGAHKGGKHTGVLEASLGLHLGLDGVPGVTHGNAGGTI